MLRGQIDALAGIVAATDVNDLAAVEVTARAVAKAHLDLQAFLGDLAEAIAFADTVIAYLDFPRLLADVQALLGEIRAEDLAIIERAVAGLAGKLGPIFSLNLGGAPKFTLDTLMTADRDQGAGAGREDRRRRSHPAHLAPGNRACGARAGAGGGRAEDHRREAYGRLGAAAGLRRGPGGSARQRGGGDPQRRRRGRRRARRGHRPARSDRCGARHRARGAAVGARRGGDGGRHLHQRRSKPCSPMPPSSSTD